MVINAFITHKKAECFKDCQDRFSVNLDTKSVAVSDGMGSTWQQKIWANVLVKAFTDSNDWTPDSKESITEQCALWRNKVEEFIVKLKEQNESLNVIYRNERNLAEGRSAGATFVGVRLKDDVWKGVVLGDSCLITWDGGNAEFYTSQKVEEFDSYPDYFDSNAIKEGKGIPLPIEVHADANKTLLMVSDPLSDFLLEKNKSGKIKEYIIELIDISRHEDFESLVLQWREEGMHNDDTTAVIIKPSEKDSLVLGAIDDIESRIEEERGEKKKVEKEEKAEEKKQEGNEQREEKQEKDTEHTEEISCEEISCEEISREISGLCMPKIDEVLKKQSWWKKFNNKWPRQEINETIEEKTKSILEKYKITKK